jgi:hypothetical protein
MDEATILMQWKKLREMWLSAPYSEHKELTQGWEQNWVKALGLADGNDVHTQDDIVRKVIEGKGDQEIDTDLEALWDDVLSDPRKLEHFAFFLLQCLSDEQHKARLCAMFFAKKRQGDCQN